MMNQRSCSTVCISGRQLGHFGRLIASALDFCTHKADAYPIYPPLDLPQGLPRGSVLMSSAWEVSHAC